MNTKIKFSKREYRLIGITLIAGLLFGWVFFHNPKNEVPAGQATEEHDHSNETIWTCSMHPQIRMDEPGQCPLCGMDLIPLAEFAGSGTELSPGEIRMTETAMKLADIQTMIVQNASPEKEVYLLGKVKPDERNIAELTARFGGRIEKLYINFTGQDVRKGEKLATIYSPALITAQKELLEAQIYKQSNPDLYKAARNKLKFWDLTDVQIDGIEEEGASQLYFDVMSPISGTVTNRHVSLGDYVTEGSSLFQVIDLNRVWVMFEAYETDLPWINQGDAVHFTIQSLPGKTYSGRIDFIDPLINQQTRIAQVRVEVPNPGLLLKPEMFASGVISSNLAGNKKEMIIPKTAILWTGKRAVVYVKEQDSEQPAFRYSEITLGPSAGNYYVVLDGLQPGDEIAVNGVFRIDAAAQLAGKTSMMNPQGGIITLAHNHADMNTSSDLAEGQSLMQKAVIKEVAAIENTGTGNLAGAEINPLFIRQLTDVYQSYLPLKNAFVLSDPQEVASAAEKVSQTLAAVNMGLLEGESHMAWMDQLRSLTSSLERIIQNHDIALQRQAFAVFNQVFYQSAKDFGFEGITAYYQYCPMALNNTGAYWLSEIKEIRNPYFGEAMLTCGEIRETMEY